MCVQVLLKVFPIQQKSDSTMYMYFLSLHIIYTDKREFEYRSRSTFERKKKTFETQPTFIP